MGPMAIHHGHKTFAVASQCSQPKIYVYSYPLFDEVSVMEGGAKLEFSHLTFSSGDYLVSVSGIPDFTMGLWLYASGEKLASVNLSHHTPTSVTFNPANWHQLCITSEAEITVWEIEQCDTNFIFKPSQVSILPADCSPGSENQVERERNNTTRTSTRMTNFTVDVPKAAKAGLVGSIAERLDQLQDNTERMIPVSHAWGPKGDLYVGCRGGQLLLVDGENLKPYVLYNPCTIGSAFQSREPSNISLKSVPEDSGSVLVQGSLDCIQIHRRGLYTAGSDGLIRLVDLSTDSVNIIEQCNVGCAVNSIGFSRDYSRMVLGSPQGCIYMYEPGNEDSLQELLDVNHGKILGLGLLASGSESCVTLRENGELQFWSLETGKLVGSMPVGIQCTALACSPLCHFVAVGTATGHVYMVDCNNMENIRLVHRCHMYVGPVLRLVFDQLGNFLLCSSDDGHVFLMDGRASENFKVLGHTDVKGHIKSISTYTEPKVGDLMVIITSGNSPDKAGATNLCSFEISHSLREDISEAIASLKGEFKVTAINRLNYVVSSPIHGAAITAGGMLYAIGQNKKIQQYTLPEEVINKKKVIELTPVEEYEGHQLTGGVIGLSPHQKWLTSCGTDGMVSVRSVLGMESPVNVQASSYICGGVQSAVYSDDCTRLLTLTQDDALTCYKWQFFPQGVSRAKSALESSRARRSRMLQRQQEQDACLQGLEDWMPPPPLSRPASGNPKEDKEQLEKERALASDEIYTTPTPTPGADATWLECREIEAHKEEDKQYSDVKNGLRVQIRDMRRTIQKMMRANETLPDLEKLGHHEFDLDIDEQVRLQNEGEALLQKIKEEIEFDNLAKMYLKEKIKTECWDSLEVKGRSILAFNSNLEVSNFPMKTRSRSSLQMLEMVTKRRKVEVLDQAARKEMAEAGRKPNSPLEDEGVEMEETEDDSKELPSIAGSLGAQYGGGNPLLFSQFELHTREQKLCQIILLEDTIFKIKKAFNSEFEDGFVKKEQEIIKIKDKNKRIHKILEDLDLKEEVVEPELSSLEKPELLLTVDDSEVKVEKFLTPEQKKEKEKQEKAEEERRLKEMGDNARERALGMMMGGVLEIKKEDELKKDIPVPAFMSNKKQEDWSEEETKMAKDYERKVKELEEEREKYRKQLETELRKLQAVIQESMASFDEGLNQLFMKKVRTQMVVYQEELKMLRLRYSMLLEEELEYRENELNRVLDEKRAAKQISSQTLQETKQQVEHFTGEYVRLQLEDKVMEKTFKKDFSDCTALQAEQLFKLFKKRPRGQKMKGDTPVFDPNSPNPFAEHSSTSRQAKAIMEAFLDEADKEHNMPEGLEDYIWERMCRYRREKVASELLVKSKESTLAEMNVYLQKRQEEDDVLKGDIEDIMQHISRLKEDQLRFTCNLEVQMMLKQGQVEIDPGSFIPDFSESVLVHRTVVEDLNSTIKQLGESKMASMVESKDFRKGILQLEWEHKRMLMLIEDLVSKMKDIQFMKVTREIQLYLNEQDYDGKKAQEISILEQTLQLLQKHHNRKIKLKKRTMRDLSGTIKQKQEENEKLAEQLEELNVSVNERTHIDRVNAEQRLDTGAEKRYQEIVQRRKLVDLAKAQAQEVAVLRAEVERLRMRTFPALVQVER
ncbi:cilia- and flagella-associated protein 43-like isoform X2 [Liolophura sinensis]